MAVVTAFALHIGEAIAQPDSRSKEQIPESNPNPEKTQQSPLPPVVIFKSDPIEAEETKTREDRRENREIGDLDAQRRMAEASEKLLALTARQNEITRTQNRIVGIEAGLLFLTFVSAIAAVYVSVNTGRRQLRAYVHSPDLQQLSIKDGKGIETHWRLSPRWVNDGATPARRVTINTSWEKFSGGIPDNYDFPDSLNTDPGQSDVQALIGPGGTVVHGDYADIPRGTVLELITKKTRVFIWGWVEYNDVFRFTRRHRTEFCVELVMQGEPPHPEAYAGFRYITRHNGSDDDCYHQPKI